MGGGREPGFSARERDPEVSVSTAAKSLITIGAINHPIGDDGNLGGNGADARQCKQDSDLSTRLCSPPQP